MPLPPPKRAPPSVSRDTSIGFFGPDFSGFGTVLGKRLTRLEDDGNGGGGMEARRKRGVAAASLVAKQPSVRTQRHYSETESSGSDSDYVSDAFNHEVNKEKRRNENETAHSASFSSISPMRKAHQASDAPPTMKHSTSPCPSGNKQPFLASSTNHTERLEGKTDYRKYIGNKRPGAQETQQPPYPFVYRISCQDTKSSRHHSTYLFEDDPLSATVMMEQRSSHLSGDRPIYQLRDYVQQFLQSSFVITKTRHCQSRFGLSRDEETGDETMLILDDELRKAIQNIATCPIESVKESYKETKATTRLEMPAPYRFLYLHRDHLENFVRSVSGSVANMIRAVIGHVEANFAAEYTEAAELVSQGKITRRHVEKLFHPNDLLVGGLFNSDDSAISVLKSWPYLDHNGMLELEFWNWKFNGRYCFRFTQICGAELPAADFDEPFDINRLQWRPMSTLSKERIERFRERGKKFWALRLPNYVFGHEESGAKAPRHVHPGRYMLDFEMYDSLHGTTLVPLPMPQNKKIDPWSWEIEPGGEPTNDEFLMMPTRIPGYDFTEKEWVYLSVSHIEPVSWNKRPYEDLVLSDDTKHLIKAMVTIRASTIKRKREQTHLPHKNFDIIAGKGNGLIMLFHGSPGTGKTLTAESVAEIAEMPLYPITCGDIGTEPEKVEDYLRLVFMLGKRWNCVLLLDEADVFLEERTLTDLQRNSLVSVFLRMLEYYEGILILTSNRVGTFDEAFRSRIHLALHYEDLNLRSRKQIWNNAWKGRKRERTLKGSRFE